MIMILLEKPPFILESKLDLAVILDATSALKHACYTLEGDYPCMWMVPELFENIENCLQGALEDGFYQSGRRGDGTPGRVRSVMDSHLRTIEDPSDRVLEKRRMQNLVREKVKPVCDYYEKKFRGKTHQTNYCKLAKISRLTCPWFVNYSIKHNDNCTFPNLEKNLNSLMSIGMIGNEDHAWIPNIDKLRGQFNAYKTACSEVNYDRLDIKEKAENLQVFWAEQYKKQGLCTFSEWIKLGHLFMLYQPSSACVERAFSLLTRISKIYGKLHHDYLESMMMLIYNSKSWSEDDLSDEDITEILKDFNLNCK